MHLSEKSYNKNLIRPTQSVGRRHIMAKDKYKDILTEDESSALGNCFLEKK